MAPVAVNDERMPSSSQASSSEPYQPLDHVPIHLAADFPKPKPITKLTNYRSSPYWHSSCPIIIDNGSSELRAGFALSDPTIPTSFPSNPFFYYDSLISKVRDRKKNLTMVLVGNDVYADGLSRSSIRSPFDNDVVTGWDAMEIILDYTFSNLGIHTDRVEHPICMTETLCNPAYSRGVMNELMFEAYQVPYVNYGVDALFSAYQNHVGQDSLIVSSGRSSTVVIPKVGGRGILNNSKRLAWGGAQASDLLLRLTQLKYPGFPARVTSWQAQHMLEELCYVSSDYADDIRGFSMMPTSHKSYSPSSWTLMEKADVIIQFPFADALPEQKSDEELQAQAERRKAAGDRLREQTRKMRLEKMMQKENDLKYYQQLKEFKGKERKAEYLKRLENDGFDNEAALEKMINKIEGALKRFRAKELGEEYVEDEKTEEPTFPLVDVPDADLDEEGIKEKRKQRLMKAGYDARLRAKAEKAEEKRLEDEALKRDEDERINNPRVWSAKMRKEYDDAINRIKERKRMKEMLSDRKSLAAQQRMKNITALASDAPASGSATPTGVRKRKKAGGDNEDTFGANDDDWAIYREIQNADDSEEEEDAYNNLSAIENRLLSLDPTFGPDDTYAARLARKNRLTLTFFNGPGGGEENSIAHLETIKDEDPSKPDTDPESIKRQHQLHLNVERIRVPEVLWQPSIAGLDQAGLDEICSHVVHSFDADVRARMLQNIFCTGRHTGYKGFEQRLYSSIRAVQPSNVVVKVKGANDRRFDAWKGAARWSVQDSQTFQTTAISKQDYEEKGKEWFREHPFSANWK
ncbi:related to ARP5 - Actin-related protein [Melanopsichium pennsylvanicum]|uniref:Related to ARP5 - Actin-related protein n=2 Tax=Melanopsichium pennsylvanicum TaxID=63383 RepID=A0AAJ5C790_9BASI|nr:related to ARP5-Actin-related protein [Melanopsichium pennsylvanicum 4]SNX86671.1 related to ARP5 - Actin-related protein [Melanopsichium pennsylvanicum]